MKKLKRWCSKNKEDITLLVEAVLLVADIVVLYIFINMVGVVL